MKMIGDFLALGYTVNLLLKSCWTGFPCRYNALCFIGKCHIFFLTKLSLVRCCCHKVPFRQLLLRSEQGWGLEQMTKSSLLIVWSWQSFPLFVEHLAVTFPH